MFRVWSLLAAISLTAGALRAEFYTVTDLGPANGTLRSYAAAINNAGQVVGSYRNAGGITLPVAFSGGGVTELWPTTGDGSVATDINASGVIVGMAGIVSAMTSQAFRRVNGVTTSLGTLGGTNSRAFGINASGVIVGVADLANNNYNAFRYFSDMGLMFNIGTLGGSNSSAYGINDSGQIVGWSQIAGDAQTHAFLYSNGAMSNLGTLGGTESRAYDINAAGDIVGSSKTAGDAATHAFLRTAAGVMKDIDTLGGDTVAYAINSSGVVVGGRGEDLGFVYSDGKMTHLNDLISPTSGWKLHPAQDIDDSGRIVGEGTAPNGTRRAYLLTPDRANPVVKADGKRNRSTSKSTLKITGTASDNVLLKSVEFKINQAGFKASTGTTRWKFTTKLKKGKNKIQVRAIDAAGNISAIVKLTITRK